LKQDSLVIFESRDLYWTSPGRKIRLRRDATGAPTQRPEWRGRRQPPPKNKPFWRQSG